ncbi:unnamed protein product [Cladocopium goreaui]|uniref:N-acetyltransferase domain-containing protein n=1 Tax=Cladocopium goreaui TaxID=2562237 RepID=A0A9P1DEU2_9DINO|nr:unnamed protein product [Cladocopium goreaui]
MATVGEVATIEPQLPQLDVVHGPKECKECKELQTAEALLRSEEEPEKVAVVEVEIGSSQSKATPRQISTLCNKAYGYRRLSESEARSRLAMGDGGSNRVLHVAYRNGELVGCCSSTLQPPWTPRSCGHWGLLSVHPDAQGTGVASALIAAAERRLLDAGCRSIQIEYEFTASDPDSERLLQWYEGKCGFKSGSPPPKRGSEFRCCRKKLDEDSVYKSSGEVVTRLSRVSLSEASESDFNRSSDEDELERRAVKMCRVS